MKKNITKLLTTLLFLTGFSLVLYPPLANAWNSHRQEEMIRRFYQTVAKREAAGEIDYQAEWDAAAAYNRSLLPYKVPYTFIKAEAMDGDDTYLSCLDIAGNGIIGIVEIPKIHSKLPIFHTSDEEVLEVAAGHLEGSFLPIGGESTHAVISAHRGRPGAQLFKDLDQLEKGDRFYLHILDETLCYEVDKISTVAPHDTRALNVEDGQDLVTLLTCTPYGEESHRLLVRGHRAPYDKEP
ncbi:class C sortase [Lachnospiraceae bacterium 29-84]